MWEFSLNFNLENIDKTKRIYRTLCRFIRDDKGIVTTHKENGYIFILIAVKNQYEEKVKNIITNYIIEIICNDFKSEFLEKNLSIPDYDKIGICAYKKALLNFDKETDKYIVKKNIILDTDLYIESFYHFKLKSLQEKWKELVSLSNDNKDYFLSQESFVDLLKFLVDNLDICEDEVSVVKEEGGYRIFLGDKKFNTNLLSEESVVSSIIDLSPQKINLYFNEPSSAITLLEKIFKERVTINSSNMPNIKKFQSN